MTWPAPSRGCWMIRSSGRRCATRRPACGRSTRASPEWRRSTASRWVAIPWSPAGGHRMGERAASRDPAVTLLVPTWNAGPEFPDILARMRAQRLDRPFEVLVIDSGSTDGTAEFLRGQPVRLVEIPNSEFNHGLTRNLGIRKAGGQIVIMATQDARPADEQWMQRLVDCFADPL